MSIREELEKLLLSGAETLQQLGVNPEWLPYWTEFERRGRNILAQLPPDEEQRLIDAIAGHSAIRHRINKLWENIEPLFKGHKSVTIYGAGLMIDEILHEVNKVCPEEIFTFTPMPDGGLKIERETFHE